MKKYLSLFLAVLMLVSMIPVLSLAEDDEQVDDQVDTLGLGQPDPFNNHTFGHIDVRIAGASFTLKRNIVDKDGNIISTNTETITANVTKVYSVTFKYSETKQTKYIGFSKSGTYEFRKTSGVSISGKDITDSTKVIIAVDLLDSKGNTHNNVSITMGKTQIVEAAKECDGYKSTHAYDGLDFQLTGEVSGQDIEVSVTSTGIGFEITKNLDGVLCTTPDLFEFELYQGNNLIASAKNDANGKAVIAVSYEDLTDFSDITYILKEKVGGEGYIYDSNEYTIVVGFHEPELNNDGQYVRTPYVKSDEITNLVFNNTTVTPTPEVTPSQEPEPTPEVTPSQEPEPTPKVTPSQEPEPTPEVTPSQEPEPTPKVTPSQEPEPTPEVTPSQEPEPTPKVTPSQEPDPSATPDPTPKYDYKEFTIEKKVVDANSEPVALEKDTTFTFQIYDFATYVGNHAYTFEFDGKPVGEDGKFTLTVEAGKMSATGTLRVGIPETASNTGAFGRIKEIGELEGWELDSTSYYFTLPRFGDGIPAEFRPEVPESVTPTEADEANMTFTNQFKEEPTPTPAPTEEPVPSAIPTIEPNVDLMIPVNKIVEKTGNYLPNTDTTFNFSVDLINKETGSVDKVVMKLGETPITDGKFSVTVKAGETSASAYLYISGPLSQIANLSGTIKEIVPENTGKWTYDTKVYSFTTDAEGGFASFGYLNDDGGLAQASVAAFTNQFKEDVPRTSLNVKKVWQDKGYEKKRPASVTVELYYYQKDSDGKDTKTKVLYKVNGEAMTAVLSESNGWSYTFENLDARFTWTVDEVKTPTGYSRKVVLSSDKKTVTVTNTYGAQPKTGLDGLPLILCMVVVMLAGGVALVVINRKKGSRKSN